MVDGGSCRHLGGDRPGGRGRDQSALLERAARRDAGTGAGIRARLRPQGPGALRPRGRLQAADRRRRGLRCGGADAAVDRRRDQARPDRCRHPQHDRARRHAGIGVAIRAGAPRPDIGSAEAFKSALLAAKSVGFAKEGASGTYFAGLLGRLGVADAMSQKLKPMPTGVEVGEAVARGDVELAVLPISEILPIQGAELLAPFPADVQSYVVMTAGVGAAAKERAAAAELIQFLKAPAALPVIAKKGMEPG